MSRKLARSPMLPRHPTQLHSTHEYFFCQPILPKTLKRNKNVDCRRLSNLTWMLEPLEKIVLITQRKDSRRRQWQGSFSSENGINLCLPGCPAAVVLGYVHFPLRTTSERINPLQRQSHKRVCFWVNSCSISTTARSKALDIVFLFLFSHCLFWENKSCSWVNTNSKAVPTQT